VRRISECRIFSTGMVLMGLFRNSEDAARLMRVYCVVAAHWPADFRPHHRATLYTLYIRTLCLTGTRGTPSWRDEARRAVTEMRVVLGSTTEFPHAGQVNPKVLDFVDACVALWDAGGEHEEDALWVVDVRVQITINECQLTMILDPLVGDSTDVPLAPRSQTPVPRTPRHTRTRHQRRPACIPALRSSRAYRATHLCRRHQSTAPTPSHRRARTTPR
jgi:hypothetical protein